MKQLSKSYCPAKVHYRNKHGEQKGQPLVLAREGKGSVCFSLGPLKYFLVGGTEELAEGVRLLSI